MGTFKRRVRRIAMHCVLKEVERHFQTCQARSNRVAGLAISNRHADIRGMPKLSEEDARRVTSAVLAKPTEAIRMGI